MALCKGYLPHHLAWQACHWVIWPSLRYPLAVTFFSKSQALLITTGLYQMLLSCLGANRSYPLALWHSPAKFQGLGLPQHFWEQGIAELKLFLEFGNTNQPEHLLLQMSLEYLQLEVRISTLVLQSNFQIWGHLATDGWLKSLWGFLSAAQIELISTDPPIFSLQCQDNAFLMDQVGTFQLSTADCVAFNQCWITHRVHFLSNIMGTWGHSLHDNLMTPNSLPGSSWNWPWASTAKLDWAIWQSLLPWLASNVALGIWLTPPHLSSFIPFNPSSSTAFISHSSSFWQTFCPLLPHAVWCLQTLAPLDIMFDLPTNFSYACIQHWSGEHLILDGHQQFHHRPPSPTVHDQALLWTQSPTDCQLLEATIWQAEAIGLSNSSYMPHHYPTLATVAWFLADAKATAPSLFSGVCTVMGPPLQLMCIEWNCRVSMLSWWHWSFSVSNIKFSLEVSPLDVTTKVPCIRHNNFTNMSHAPTHMWILSEPSLLSIFAPRSTSPSFMSLATKTHLLGSKISLHLWDLMCGLMPWQKRTPLDSLIATLSTCWGFFTGGMMVW